MPLRKDRNRCKTQSGPHRSRSGPRRGASVQFALKRAQPAPIMATTAAPIVSPLSPAIKRSTRKRQRPSFFSEEIEVKEAPSRRNSSHTRSNSISSNSSAHSSSSSSGTSTRPRRAHDPSKRSRSDLSELHETVDGLRAQIELASTQMQELRELVTTLADLYRRDQDDQESVGDDDDLLLTPLSPMI